MKAVCAPTAASQACPGELVDDVEHTGPSAIVGSSLDKVVGPAVIGTLGPKPDARSFTQPEPTSLRLLLGNLQPLPLPDPFDTLGVHRPALGPEHRRDAAISIAAVARGQSDGVGSQRLFIGPALRFLALGRAKNLAGEAL